MVQRLVLEPSVIGLLDGLCQLHLTVLERLEPGVRIFLAGSLVQFMSCCLGELLLGLGENLHHFCRGAIADLLRHPTGFLAA
jgi:hypothetical protein